MNGEYKKDKKKEEEEGRSHLHTIRVDKTLWGIVTMTFHFTSRDIA